MKSLCGNDENVFRGNYYEVLIWKCRVIHFKEETGLEESFVYGFFMNHTSVRVGLSLGEWFTFK